MQLTVHQRYMIAAVVVASILLVHFLGAVLTPFVVSMVLVYLGDPLADWLEAKGQLFPMFMRRRSLNN